jgi:hypothetical protein
MEILLGTNAERTRNFSHGITSTFFLIFSYRKKIKFLRKDFDPSYLRIGQSLMVDFDITLFHMVKPYKNLLLIRQDDF